MAEEISSADESAETNPTALTEPELSAEDKTELTAEAATDETTDHNADEKPEDSVADKGKDGAPEEYSDFTLPEGVNLDAAAVAEAIPLLKEMGATQEQAQKLVDLQVQTMTGLMDAQSKAWTDQLGEWKDARETDAEFGKSKYDESIAIARKGMREFGEPALFAALEETGMGNHPELIRAFYRVGKAIGEDGFNFGSSNTEGGQSLAEKLFPNQGKAA
jgi:hypothetical protein|tara:strand:+ start:551 stop:1207 length:657 start_codon:yes stop_codon:yes gene_type:complete